MGLRYTQCTIQTGTLGEGEHFGPAGKPGDWQEFSASFTQPLSPTLPSPRVFITPALDNSFHRGSAPVCVITAATSEGFTVAARNISNSAGETAFTWVAMCDTAEKDPIGTPLTHDVPGLRVGALAPRSFAPDGEIGDLQTWPTPRNFSPLGVEVDPFSIELSSVLMTPANLNVTTNNVAAVGLVDRPQADGLAVLTARNSDSARGECAFYWAVFAQSALFDSSKREPSIETGAAFSSFAPSGSFGDWQFEDIYFSDPFLTPPVILLSGLIVNHRLAVVGLAQDVTPYGFRLAMRNADIIGGPAGCSWAAIGWPTS
jgi:hypothetical protein